MTNSRTSDGPIRTIAVRVWPTKALVLAGETAAETEEAVGDGSAFGLDVTRVLHGALPHSRKEMSS